MPWWPAWFCQEMDKCNFPGLREDLRDEGLQTECPVWPRPIMAAGVGVHRTHLLLMCFPREMPIGTWEWAWCDHGGHRAALTSF